MDTDGDCQAFDLRNFIARGNSVCGLGGIDWYVERRLGEPTKSASQWIDETDQRTTCYIKSRSRQTPQNHLSLISHCRKYGFCGGEGGGWNGHNSWTGRSSAEIIRCSVHAVTSASR